MSTKMRKVSFNDPFRSTKMRKGDKVKFRLSSRNGLGDTQHGTVTDPDYGQGRITVKNADGEERHPFEAHCQAAWPEMAGA